MVVGTAPYMSPEQARGLKVDARTDIWSLGVMIYEAVAGRKPFSGDTTPDVINAVIEKTPAPLTRYASEVPEALEWIVSRALRKEKDARYQTANELLTDLKELTKKIELAKATAGEVPAGSTPSRREVGASVSSAPPSTSSAEYVVNEIKRHKTVASAIVALLALVLAGIGYGIYKWTAKQIPPAPAFQSAKFTRLTTSGKASDAGISPDGKYVAHVKSDAGQQSLWLRQVAIPSDTQIVPPSQQNYYGVTFSKDGDYIYYVLGEPNNPATRALYQVPALGSASRKLIEQVASPVSLSPDGTRLAFMRDSATETALVVANADGTGERPVAVRKLTNGYSTGGPSWSPDGKLLASGVTNYDPGEGRAAATVVEVQVEGGAERPITSHTWPPNVRQVAWLADGSGLVLLAVEQGTSSAQVWYLSYPGGEVRKITNDLNNYSQLSLTADSSALVTVQTEGASSVWVAPQGDASRAKQISSSRYDGAQGLSWMPSGRIVYTSRGAALPTIWSMGQDGQDQKQLTANAGSNVYPWATPDGRYIVFTSTRARSSRSVWRMDADGGNLKRLTGGPGDIYPQSSPDGRWVVFQSARSGSVRVWKVSIDGGEPVPLTDKWTANPTVSPDGSLIACFYREGQQNATLKVAIIPFAGGDPVKVLDIPYSVSGPAGLRWTPDGHALTFIDTINGVSNIWSLPLDGGAPKQLTDFKTDEIFWFDFSRDGRQLALSRGTRTSDVILIRDFR
jgi:Tol biopolymer transport system component